jgi:hypothetical protein
MTDLFKVDVQLFEYKERISELVPHTAHGCIVTRIDVVGGRVQDFDIERRPDTFEDIDRAMRQKPETTGG